VSFKTQLEQKNVDFCQLKHLVIHGDGNKLSLSQKRNKRPLKKVRKIPDCSYFLAFNLLKILKLCQSFKN